MIRFALYPSRRHGESQLVGKQELLIEYIHNKLHTFVRNQELPVQINVDDNGRGSCWVTVLPETFDDIMEHLLVTPVKDNDGNVYAPTPRHVTPTPLILPIRMSESGGTAFPHNPLLLGECGSPITPSFWGNHVPHNPLLFQS